MRLVHDQCTCENIFSCYYHKRIRQKVIISNLTSRRYVVMVYKVGYMISRSVKVYKRMGIEPVGLKGNIKLIFGPESHFKSVYNSIIRMSFKREYIDIENVVMISLY